MIGTQILPADKSRRLTAGRLVAAGLAFAAMVLSAGCLPAFLKKAPPYSLAGWEIWPGQDNAYGSYEVKKDGLYYRLTGRQDDTREAPSDGYFPGLILSRELRGSEWLLDMEADFLLPPGGIGRFSCGVWLGDSYARPDLGNFSSVFILLFRRQNETGPGKYAVSLTHIPGGRPYAVPLKAKVIRFERRGSELAMSYSLNRKDFTRAFQVSVPDAGTAPAQKFFIGGFAGGEAAGARARFKSLKFNGQELLREQTPPATRN
jgi:hypothetical protein